MLGNDVHVRSGKRGCKAPVAAAHAGAAVPGPNASCCVPLSALGCSTIIAVRTSNSILATQKQHGPQQQ
jgi:hypothetical protein